jgi:hypothetical protein
VINNPSCIQHVPYTKSHRHYQYREEEISPAFPYTFMVQQKNHKNTLGDGAIYENGEN